MNSRTLLGIVALVVLGLLAWELRWVLLVLFGAIVLAVALDVPISLLRRLLPLNRGVSLVIVVVSVVVVGGLLSQLLLPELVDQIHELTDLIPIVYQRLIVLAGQIPGLPNLENQLLQPGTLEQLQPVGTQLLGLAGGAASSTIQLMLMALLAILFALDPRSHQNILIAITPELWRHKTRDVRAECRQALGGWLAGMTLSAVSVFLLTWAGLAALKVPLALLSGLVCGMLTFVPTIGPSAATLLPLALALLVSPATVVQVLVLRLILQNVEAFLITPLLLSRTVNLLPTISLMAQLCLGALLGLPGVLLALPLVVVLQVICEEVVVKEVMDRWV